MTISVRYNLIGKGWSECIIKIGDRQARLTASYLSDALADLLDAVTLIVKGTNEATTSFTEESGEYRWRFKRVTRDRLEVLILWFNETWSDRPDEEGEVILEAECRLKTFAGAVLSASQRVLTINGLDGYKEKWVNYEFPGKLQTKLQKALR
ncbi:hypothetical protein [Myxosarcina sp. GI1]|uniref:hypothetical protein n=1 Tax=Myxosarcina sp. GI1 TaxID=1541065 RepID=UPI00056006FF|nr:hypothetical protein [Myxosarcina sp. GI1]